MIKLVEAGQSAFLGFKIGSEVYIVVRFAL